MELLSDEFKRNKTVSRVTRIAVVSVLAVLMLVFTFCDLQTSEALYHNDNAFGIFFSNLFFAVGYVPAIFVDAVLFACLFWMVKHKGLRVLFAFLAFSAVCGALYTVFESFDNVHRGIKFGVMGGGGAVCTAGLLYLISRFKDETRKKLFYIFLIGAIMALLSILIIMPMQQFWGRTRFYALSEDRGEFTKWLIPQGVPKDDTALSRDFRSFPSMHASSAASMVMLMLIAWKFNFKRAGKIVMFGAAIFVIVCVCLSRVVMGWHYMTDVIFGLLIPYLCFEAGVYIADKIYRKKGLATPPQPTETQA